MGKSSTVYPQLSNPIFQRDIYGSKINKVEKWYTSDPTISGSYAMKG